MNTLDSMTDCNKREGLWQLSQRQSVRAFDNVAALHVLIAKLLIYSHNLSDHHDSFMCSHVTFYVSTTTTRLRLHPSHCVFKWIFYLVVQLSSARYNRRPITLSHLHAVRMNPNCSISQPRRLLPGTTCHRDILQQYQRKHFGDSELCAFISVP